MIFKTESGSTYEIDLKDKRVRRLSGAGSPTARVGTDGEWKSYVGLWGEPSIGENLMIVWSTGDGIGGGDRCTCTSKLTEIQP